jgi:hypothetical protein
MGVSTTECPSRQGPPHGARTLRRTLNLWQVSVAGIGVILRAGVYALVGPAAGLAGHPARNGHHGMPRSGG